LQEFLRSFEIRPNEDVGQHFLLDRSTISSICKAAGSDGTVVEVGAAMGTLTCPLKERFSTVYAIELYGGFQEPFERINPEENVKFIEGNVLDMDFAELVGDGGEKSKLIGNIPYNITGKILRKAIGSRDLFDKAVFTLQREVADRILAEPGTKNCSRMSYLIRAYGNVSRVMDVPPKHFYPQPEVFSTVLKINFHEKGWLEVDESLFDSILRGSFTHRRKTIRNGLTSTPEFSFTREEVESILEAAGIDSGKRPEELTLDEFYRLAGQIESTTGN
jgi:16S rRNA (adenine1518-N6/adenine1519-N6)-dimethyltransferase